MVGMKKKFGIENERLTDNGKVNNVLNGGSRRGTIIRAAITRQVEGTVRRELTEMKTSSIKKCLIFPKGAIFHVRA